MLLLLWFFSFKADNATFTGREDRRQERRGQIGEIREERGRGEEGRGGER